MFPAKSINMKGVNISTVNTKYQLKTKNGRDPSTPKMRNVRGVNLENAITIATNTA